MSGERAPVRPGGWRPLCAICALLGLRVEADTLIADHPVCIDHAGLLAGELRPEGLLRAVRTARGEFARPQPTTEEVTV